MVPARRSFSEERTGLLPQSVVQPIPWIVDPWTTGDGLRFAPGALAPRSGYRAPVWPKTAGGRRLMSRTDGSRRSPGVGTGHEATDRRRQTAAIRECPPHRVSGGVLPQLQSRGGSSQLQSHGVSPQLQDEPTTASSTEAWRSSGASVGHETTGYWLHADAARSGTSVPADPAPS